MDGHSLGVSGWCRFPTLRIVLSNYPSTHGPTGDFGKGKLFAYAVPVNYVLHHMLQWLSKVYISLLRCHVFRVVKMKAYWIILKPSFAENVTCTTLITQQNKTAAIRYFIFSMLAANQKGFTQNCFGTSYNSGLKLRSLKAGVLQF